MASESLIASIQPTSDIDAPSVATSKTTEAAPENTAASEVREKTLFCGKAFTRKQFIDYAASAQKKDSGRLAFLKWKKTNIINVNSQDDEGSRACAEIGTGDEVCDPEAAMQDPDVLVIAVMDDDQDTRDAYTTFEQDYLGFYDVAREILYVNASRETKCETCVAGKGCRQVLWSSVGDFEASIAGAYVLCIDMETAEAYAFSTLMDTEIRDMEALLHRLEGEEKNRYIWKRNLQSIIMQGLRLIEEEDISNEIKGLETIFRMGEAVYPGSTEQAYTGMDFLHHLVKACRLPLFKFHLENGAAESEMQSLDYKLNKGFDAGEKVKHVEAREVLKRFTEDGKAPEGGDSMSKKRRRSKE